jgi:hypothetical protein
MLAALHGFLTARRRMVAGMMSGALFSVLALLSKETALALPLLLAVLPGLFPQAFPTGRRAAAALAVCAAVSAAFFALWAFLPTDLQALGGSWNGESLRFPDNLYSLPAVWGRTVRYLLAPWPLNVTPSFEPVRSMASWRFWGGAVLAAGWGWAAWRLRRTRPWLSFGLIWAAALFLPVSNLIPLLHPVADRYLYPMTPGIAVAAAWGLSRWPRPARGAVLALLAALCAGLVAVRIGEWESGERLWTRAYERNPRSATAAVWLGLLREEAGDPAGAREWYARAAEANPREAAAWINWGILEGRQGAWPESERLLRRALDVRPESAKARHNLAVCLERQGRLAEAEALRGDQGSPNP